MLSDESDTEAYSQQSPVNTLGQHLDQRTSKGYQIPNLSVFGDSNDFTIGQGDGRDYTRSNMLISFQEDFADQIAEDEEEFKFIQEIVTGYQR